MSKKIKEYRLFLLGILSAGILFVFFKPISQTSLAIGLKNLLLLQNGSPLGDIVFGILFLVAISLAYIKIKNEKTFEFKLKRDALMPLIALIIYIPLRLKILDGQQWFYTHFKYINEIRYMDVIVLLIIIISIKPNKRFVSQPTSKNSLIEDNLFTSSRIDILHRENYATHIANLINEQTSKKSFVIGISGRWGSGKSVFMEQVESKLKFCIPIRFNPWLSKKTSHIVEDFLNIIVETVLPY